MSRKKMKNPSFSMVHPNAAGIDIGSSEHWVAVPKDRDEKNVRCFECFTHDLHALAQWLKACGIETVAMESTGVYWIPVFQILESHGFEVKLVNAKHVKNVPGRKTDVSDCQWLQQLHSFGLLTGSFRPEDSICVLRSYWRHRDNLVSSTTAHVQHMQKALTQMNVQLHKVISDITGVTGMRIIKAILGGERDPYVLAKMKDKRIRSSVKKIAKALEGDYRKEHLFSLKQTLETYEFYKVKIQECDRQIESHLMQMESKCKPEASKTKGGKKKPRGNCPDFNLKEHLHRISGVDFTQIEGFDVLTVHTILSEVGLNPDAFKTSKRFASWLGLCPNNKITGGKIKNSKTRKVVNRAATAFRMAAYSLNRSNSGLGAYYRRIKARLGAPKAITATAHKLSRIFFHLWKTGGSYESLSVDYYEIKYKERVIRNMKNKARQLGFDISMKPVNKNEAPA
jgi:transposase